MDKNFKYNGKAWNPETQSWSDDPKHLGTDWRSSCAKCHTTGFNPDTKKAISLGIACEDCHGPGAAHAATGDKTKITVSLSDDVCATCHGQQKQLENMGKVWFNKEDGTTPRDGHSDHFKNLLATETYKDSCTKCHSATVISAIKEKQTVPTLEDFRTGALKDDRMGITCVVCHSPHKKTNDFQLSKDPQTTCLQCHTNDGPVVAGKAPHHAQKEFFEGQGIGVTQLPKMNAQCVECHMPDGNHYFKVGTPTADIQDTHGNPVTINSCVKCHSTMTSEEVKGMQDNVKEKYEDLNKILTDAKAKLGAAEKAGKDVTAAKPLVDASITNLGLIDADASYGMHNYSFAQELLKKAEEDLASFSKLSL